jgi:Zn-dependent protease with chaperone function
MTHEEFDQFIRRIEGGIGRDPGALRRRVLELAALGYAGLLAPLVLVVAVSLGLIIPGIVWFPDAIACLILGAFVLSTGGWAVGHILWVKIGAPKGRPVARPETPELFALIDEIRLRTNAAPFHSVLVTPDCNAAVSYSPRLGVLGWNRNHLLVGLPLMDGLSRDEFASVLAHECAHLSRRHHWSGHWIYRLRRSWEQVFALFNRPRQANEVSLRPLLRKFVQWFWPRFNAHAFVLSRAQEFQADAVAADFAGRDNAATALIRVAWHGDALAGTFWPRYWQRAVSCASPPAGVFSEVASFLGQLGEDEVKTLEQTFKCATTNADTHPCLADRLQAIGWHRDGHVAVMAPPCPTAAAVLLGAALPAVRADVEALWRKGCEAKWLQEHRKVNVLQDRLEQIDHATAARREDVDALWDKARVLLQMHTPEAAVPLLRQIVALDPRHTEANFHLGGFLLRSGDGEGCTFLDRAIVENEDLLPQAMALFHSYYRETGQPDRLRELYARMDNYEKNAAASRRECTGVSAGDTFLPHGLSDGQCLTLQKALAAEKDIIGADLARKQLRHSTGQQFYLLCIRIRPEWYFLVSPARQQEVINRLVKTVQLAGRLLIVGRSGGFRRVARKVARLPGSRVFSR